MQMDEVKEELENGIPQADVAVDLSSIDQIEQLVHKPTWREMLLDIVTANDMDPWNIDVSVITNSYIEKVKRMKIQDLYVPANVILRCFNSSTSSKRKRFNLKSQNQLLMKLYLQKAYLMRQRCSCYNLR